MSMKKRLTEIVGNILAKVKEEPEHYDFPLEDSPRKVVLELWKKRA